MRRWMLAVLVAAVAGASASAGLEEGIQAYREFRYDEALRELRPLADAGNPAAQYYMGAMFHHGRGLPEDPARALSWYRRAAQKDSVEAMHGLGVLYDSGRGVPRDYREAARWYRRAAELGYARAQISLGVMLAVGKGSEPDPIEAYAWFTLAAAQGESEAREARALVARDMNADEIAEAQGLARRFSRGDFPD